MRVKKFLNQLREHYELIEEKKEKLRYIEERLTSISGGFKVGEVVSGSRSTNTQEKLILEKIELEELIKEDYKEILRLEKKIMRLIDLVDDEKSREILAIRYLSGASWDKVAESMKICKRSCFRRHELAIEQIEKKIARK